MNREKSITVDSLRFNGKKIILIGEIHVKRHSTETTQEIQRIIRANSATPEKTIILFEGQDLSGYTHFKQNGLIPDWHEKNWRTIPLESKAIFDMVTRRYKFDRQMYRNIIRLLFGKKPSNFTPRNAYFVHFRDFIQATTIREIASSPECPENIIVLQGRGHTTGVARFLRDERYYRRYRHLILHLTKKPRRVFLEKVVDLKESKRDLRPGTAIKRRSRGR